LNTFTDYDFETPVSRLKRGTYTVTTGYQDIAAAIRRQIEQGQHRPGEPIPTEQALAERFGCARLTVRRALDMLKREGLLASRTSQGTYVPYPTVQLAVSRYRSVIDPHRHDAHLGPWEATVAAHGFTGDAQVYAVTFQPASGQVAQLLGIPVGADTVCRHRHMTIEGEVAQVQHAYMPGDIAEGTPFASEDNIVGGVYAAMTSAGIEVHFCREEIGARPARRDETIELDLPDGACVLDLWRVTYGAVRGPRRAVEATQTIATASRNRLVYDDLPLR
jgi:GntR family transcriptional regulator